MERMKVEFHHMGYFVDEEMKTYEGELTSWEVDPDKWSYFEVIGNLNEMGYTDVVGIWYDINGHKKLLENDQGAMEMLKWAESNGCVHMFTIHPISQPYIMPEIPIPGPKPILNEAAPHLRKTVPKAQYSHQAHVVIDVEGQSEETETNREEERDQFETTNEGQGDETETNREEERDQFETTNEGQRDQYETTNEGQRDQYETTNERDQTETNKEGEKDQHETNEGDSDDSAKNVRWNDSDDEVGDNDGFEEIQQPQPQPQEQEHQQQEPEVVEQEVGEGTSRRKKTHNKGRPKRRKGKEPVNAPTVETHHVPFMEDNDDSDAFLVCDKRKRESAKVDRGLSDEDYYSEAIETDDSDDTSDEREKKTKYPSFVMPKNMEDYKWVRGSLF